VEDVSCTVVDDIKCCKVFDSAVLESIGGQIKHRYRDVELFVFYRRIAYQESSQTFGVISMRSDVQDSNGTTPVRPSASTMAQNSSSSGTGTKLLMTSGSGNALGDHVFGDEIDVHSLLILDQHTFEGEISSCCSAVFPSSVVTVKLQCCIN
jgi:hypothetical protein